MNLQFKMNTFIVTLLLGLLSVNCSSTSKVSQKKHLEVFYVPFSMSTEGRLFESEVRDLSIPYVSYYCTSEKSIVEEFEEFVLNLSTNPEKEIKDIAPYMVIDLFSNPGVYEKIVIGPSIFFEKNGQVYLMSKEFKDWVSNNFPEATFPIGSRVPNCSG